MSAHPLTVFQSIIKGTSTLAGCPDEPEIFFHLKNKGHTYRMKELEKMLKFEPKPNDSATAYMPLGEFRDRKVLPKPTEV